MQGLPLVSMCKGIRLSGASDRKIQAGICIVYRGGNSFQPSTVVISDEVADDGEGREENEE